MITKEFLQYTGFCAPIISSLGCAIMLVLFRPFSISYLSMPNKKIH